MKKMTLKEALALREAKRTLDDVKREMDAHDTDAFPAFMSYMFRGDPQYDDYIEYLRRDAHTLQVGIDDDGRLQVADFEDNSQYRYADGEWEYVE